MALSAPSAACSGPEKHAQIPAAMIKAERPLALIVIGNLPMLPDPEAQGELRACPQRGKKRESSGESGRKQGSAAAGRAIRYNPEMFWTRAAVSAGPNDAMRLPKPISSSPIPAQDGDPYASGVNHDFVIDALERNELKDR